MFDYFPNSVYALGFQSLNKAVWSQFVPETGQAGKGIPIAIPMA